MAAAASKNVQLALALPTRLRTFLARYPPAQILPMKHPATGRWHDPKYSLRRQADLVKMAREHGVEELLPFTHKGTETRLGKRVELGLRVRGTGVGQKVKGHKHERQLEAKYVWAGCWVWLEHLLGLVTNRVRQDGQEEAGHARHARAHQGMEEGLPDALPVVCFAATCC
jgi:large subunit ribosomal protein L25